MYVLQNNVELVMGAKRSCIYDLNTKKMYSLASDDVDILRRILSNEISTKVALLSDTGRYLLNAGIVVNKEELLPKIDVPKEEFIVRFAWIEITQNCNLICRHCYEGSSRTECKSEISLEQFQHVVDELERVGIDSIQLVGGEPLVHSQISQMIDYVAGKFSYIEIFTNGTLLTDGLLNQISSCGITLALSYYAEQPMLHDWVTRTKGSFKLTHLHIQQALDKGVPVRLASVEMKNIPLLHLTSFDVPYRTDLPRLIGRADLSLYSRDMLKRKLIVKDSFARPIEPTEYYRNKVLHNCFGERLYIDCELNLYPCAMERRITYGNLLNSTLDVLLHNKFASMTKDKIQGCKDCEYRYACYDCRCDARNASIDAKPWYCTYDPIHGVWIEEEAFIDMLLAE